MGGGQVADDSSVVARGRLAVLSAHLSACLESTAFTLPVLESSCTSAQVFVAPPPNLKGSLAIADERTGKKYRVQVSDEGTVRATDLKKITTGSNDKGLKLYDPGYLNTAPVRSSICYIDGDEGILRYRGYPIEELAESMYGNLPSQSQLADWEFTVAQHSAVPQGILDIIHAMPHDAHPMGVLVSAMSALSVFHPDANPALRGQDLYKSKPVRDKQIVRILGKAPTIAAAAYLRMAGRPPVLPSSNLSYSENFLYMLDSLYVILVLGQLPLPDSEFLTSILCTCREHEMNCSTAAARHLASSGVDVYTALAGAVGALYGPLHGGANEAVLKMLNEIGSVDNIPEFIEGVKNRLVFLSDFVAHEKKNVRFWAPCLQKLRSQSKEYPLTAWCQQVAIALEQAALSDEYFVKRKLYPNVDFYSGLIYRYILRSFFIRFCWLKLDMSSVYCCANFYWNRAMGFPTEFFPVLFAIPRMAGYLSHWRESLDDPDTKIMRPAQVYTGVWMRHYIPAQERMSSASTEAVVDKLGQLSVSNATRRRLSGSGI
ncbi:hypothetical protein OSB04_018067 [Centaurea solstitialis]|uniref:Citrate synthase n=1 Tax=Centaurea solstitialis TaxID=347529 RepID=A0AA38TM54_9ASTR|nr:hypothetical protein OSB04_018067 [Centaurea solstitialis]